MAKTPLQHSHHIVPTLTYVKTIAALFILMGLTVWAAFVPFPGGVVTNNLVALAIAFTKSFLVIWVFMGIRWASNFTRLWAVCGFIVLPLMFIMFQDFMVRGQEVVPGWTGNQGSALPRILNPEVQNQQPSPEADGMRPHDPG
jgi:cytochrome c oxidase subunit 4